MDSTRLPGKVLLEAVGRPMLGLMIERLKKVNNVSDIIVATTTKEIDNQICDLAIKEGVGCYRGSENDVMGRVLDCALHNDTEIIVEITGDNPLSDPFIVSNMINKYIEIENEIDFLSTDIGYYNECFPVNFPLGISVKIFPTKLLFDVSMKTDNPVDREHVVNYILNNTDQYRVYNYKAEKEYSRPEMRFTMDYMEDYVLIKKVFENFENNEFTGLDVIDFLDRNPRISDINKNCIQSKYTYE